MNDNLMRLARWYATCLNDFQAAAKLVDITEAEAIERWAGIPCWEGEGPGPEPEPVPEPEPPPAAKQQWTPLRRKAAGRDLET